MQIKSRSQLPWFALTHPKALHHMSPCVPVIISSCKMAHEWFFFIVILFAQCWMTTFRTCDCFILSMYGCYTQATACNNQLVTSIVVTRLWNGCYNLLLQPCGQVMKALWQGCINLFFSKWVGVFSGIPDNVVGFGGGRVLLLSLLRRGGWLDQWAQCQGFMAVNRTESEGITRGSSLFTNSHKSLATCVITILQCISHLIGPLLLLL